MKEHAQNLDRQFPWECFVLKICADRCEVWGSSSSVTENSGVLECVILWLSASDIVSHPRRPESQCDDITTHYPLIMYSQGKW